MKVLKEIPKADYAIIGGSVFRPICFPEDLADPDIEVVDTGMVFETPVGETIPFKLFQYNDQAGIKRRVLYARYLGIRTDSTRLQDTEQVFWVFKEAGVRRIISEDCLGSLNPILEPGDIVLAHDFIDMQKYMSVMFMPGKLIRMQDAYCPEIQNMLFSAAVKAGFRNVAKRGVYTISPGTRFESPAEIAMYRLMGGNMVGYSLAPMIYLARAINACFSGIYVIVNYGEGMFSDWDHDIVWDKTREVTPKFGKIVLDILKQLPADKSCSCEDYLSSRPIEVMDYPDK